VLPDRHRITAPAQRHFNRFPIRLTRARRKVWFWKRDRRFFFKRANKIGDHPGLICRVLLTKGGGHLVGPVFCRSPSPTAGRTYSDSSGSEVTACGFSTHTSGLLDAPQRPAQLSQCDNLLLLFVAQDIAHADAA